jgi:hypothetical protein
MATAFFVGLNLSLNRRHKKKSREDHRLFRYQILYADCCGGPLKERETSQAGMPLLTDLLFNRKAG